jgi:hypothetical protein
MTNTKIYSMSRTVFFIINASNWWIMWLEPRSDRTCGNMPISPLPRRPDLYKNSRTTGSGGARILGLKGQEFFFLMNKKNKVGQ